MPCTFVYPADFRQTERVLAVYIPSRIATMIYKHATRIPLNELVDRLSRLLGLNH